MSMFLNTKYLVLTYILGFSLCVISCMHQKNENTAKLLQVGKSNSYRIILDKKEVGVISRIRGEGNIIAHSNSGRSWLVIEDGISTDSYPKLSIYRIVDGSISKSIDFQALEQAFYSASPSGPSELVFTGFNPDGRPTVAGSGKVSTLIR